METELSKEIRDSFLRLENNFKAEINRLKVIIVLLITIYMALLVTLAKVFFVK